MRPATANQSASKRFVKLVTSITPRRGNILGTGLAFDIGGDEDLIDDENPTPLSKPFCVYSMFDHEIGAGDVIEVERRHGVILAKDILG